MNFYLFKKIVESKGACCHISYRSSQELLGFSKYKSQEYIQSEEHNDLQSMAIGVMRLLAGLFCEGVLTGVADG